MKWNRSSAHRRRDLCRFMTGTEKGVNQDRFFQMRSERRSMRRKLRNLP